MYFLSWIIVGLIAGSLTGRALNTRAQTPVVDSAMGVTGAVAAGLVMRLAGHGEFIYSILAAILVAVILTAFTAYATGRKRYA